LRPLFRLIEVDEVNLNLMQPRINHLSKFLFSQEQQRKKTSCNEQLI